MQHPSPETGRYANLRRGGAGLGRLAAWLPIGFVLLGAGLFLDQARDLVSDGQFTTGERRVMGIIALVTFSGSVLAGWILSRLFRTLAGVLEVLADSAEASWRTGDLIEQHLVPTLGRIALAVEESHPAAAQPADDRAEVARRPQALIAELDRAKAAGRAGRAVELRDALTRHLRGEALHRLDRDLALWLLRLVEARVQSDAVDVELADWVARAVDSLGDMPEAEPLRRALPALQRRAEQRAGRQAAGHSRRTSTNRGQP
ncbi:hypothetical protein OJF2_23300 [Aquisphaera giovannonii]|uniref:Uncharacterized protein n=1 Tax=Aquisphaera giovannonii TaxID=406548 RepID=A0A5B9W0H9_9BACT|nr:hypothetical protein [Aquisphaera giovannonii]QEH33801.1 hypothetical protein OJF2_23300 [Aquisphaera giovannonii]